VSDALHEAGAFDGDRGLRGEGGEDALGLLDLVARGLGVLLVSSDLPELLGLSHRVLVLSQGRPTALLEGGAMTAAAVMQAATARGAA
jgi:hypothetical protein